MLRKILQVSLILALFAFSITVFNLVTQAGSANAADSGYKGSISVSGRGEITIKPDVAYIQVALETKGSTAIESHEANAKQFVEVTKALKALNISDKDVKTMRFNTYPYYDWINNSNVLQGYRTEQTIQVTYREMGDIGPLLDTLAKAGVNRVDGISYSTEKMEAYQLDAIDKAIDNARMKADRMAKKTGVTIKGVLSINENGISSPPIYINPGYYTKSDGVAYQAAPATQISPGEMKIEATVSVVYSY